MKIDKFCGSFRDHTKHEWDTPHRVWVGEVFSRVTYVCDGSPVVEGSHCSHYIHIPLEEAVQALEDEDQVGEPISGPSALLRKALGWD